MCTGGFSLITDNVGGAVSDTLTGIVGGFLCPS